jgi:hypothetical protein
MIVIDNLQFIKIFENELKPFYQKLLMIKSKKLIHKNYFHYSVET